MPGSPGGANLETQAISRIFNQPCYLIRQFGEITTPEGECVLNWKTSIFDGHAGYTIFAGSERAVRLLQIRAASLVNAGAGFDVSDCASNRIIGILAPRVLQSWFGNTWRVFGPDGADLASLSEACSGPLNLRTFLLGPLKQQWQEITSLNGWRLGRLVEPGFTWFERWHRLELFDVAPELSVDPRLLVAVGLASAHACWKSESRFFG
jgi:hypothetical protein